MRSIVFVNNEEIEVIYYYDNFCRKYLNKYKVMNYFEEHCDKKRVEAKCHKSHTGDLFIVVCVDYIRINNVNRVVFRTLNNYFLSHVVQLDILRNSVTIPQRELRNVSIKCL